MGETGSITRGWKEEESCTRELFCVLGLGKPRPKTQNNSLVQDSSSFHPLVMEPLYLHKKKICHIELTKRRHRYSDIQLETSLGYQCFIKEVSKSF